MVQIIFFVRRGSTRSSCAIAAARSDHGRWSGVSSMSVLSSRQRILSLWLPRLPTDRLARLRETPSPRLRGEGNDPQTRTCRESPSPDRLRFAQSVDLSPQAGRGEGSVVYGKRGNVELIVALDEAAERLGLAKGLPLAQVRAMHPALIAIEEEPDADSKLLDQLADWCLRYTPLVACDPPDGLLLDITGCAHLYGGEDKLIAD